MKKILIAAAVLAIVLILGLVYVWGNMDRLVKNAIQTYGSEATKTDVRVDTVKVQLKDGKVTVNGLSVANPAGFTTPNIFKLGAISTRVDIASLNKNPIVIDDIDVRNPTVVYEINQLGISNIDVLKKNLHVGAGKTRNSAPAGSKPMKFIIHRIVIDGSTAQVRIAALNQEQKVVLPRIVLTDVGARNGGATAEEVAREVAVKMADSVKNAVAKQGLDKYLSSSTTALKSQMQKELGNSVGGQASQIGNALKGLLGQ